MKLGTPQWFHQFRHSEVVFSEIHGLVNVTGYGTLAVYSILKTRIEINIISKETIPLNINFTSSVTKLWGFIGILKRMEAVSSCSVEAIDRFILRDHSASSFLNNRLCIWNQKTSCIIVKHSEIIQKNCST